MWLCASCLASNLYNPFYLCWLFPRLIYGMLSLRVTISENSEERLLAAVGYVSPFKRKCGEGRDRQRVQE